MRLPVLLRLVALEASRARGALVTAGAGVALGVSALVFFVALGLGARAVLLGDVFPIDQIELEPQRAEPSLMGLLIGGNTVPGIEQSQVDRLERVAGVRDVSPKLAFRFPASARGGQELLGRALGTSELPGDGVEPSLIEEDLRGVFRDPLPEPSQAVECRSAAECGDGEYCEFPGDADVGRCSRPVPVLVSRYLVEIFDKSIAPAHGYPPIASTLVERAKGITFEITLGSSALGQARRSKPRLIQAEVVGVSQKAIDLGATMPIAVVRRFNREYAGDEAARRYSSVVVRTDDARFVSAVVDEGKRMGLVAKETSARDVSALLNAVLALLVLVAVVVLIVAALNIAHTFRVLVSERRREIGLYRALGATRGDVRLWLLAIAVAVGAGAGVTGTMVAWVAAQLVDRRAAVDLPDFPFKPDSFFLFPAPLVGGAIAFAIVFAGLGALYPAWRAGRTDPAELLDSEH